MKLWTPIWLIGIALCSVPASALRDPINRDGEAEFEPPPYLQRAQEALLSRRFSEATDHLRAAQACWALRGARCGFGEADYLSLTGVLYLELGEWPSARHALRQAVKRRPEPGMAWFYLGQVEGRLGEPRAAALAFERAGPEAEKLPGTFHLWFLAWKKAGEPAKAEAVLQQGLTRFPKDPALLDEGSELYLELGLYDAALELARRYGEIASKRPETPLLRVAESMRRAGWMNDAIPVFEEARLVATDKAQASLRLAYAYTEAGQTLSAAQLFESLGPDWREQAIRLYQAAGWKAKALELQYRAR